MFCERCGSLRPKPEANTPRSAGVLARRVLDAVGITETQRTHADDWLRLCLNCRGYSCPKCWNDADGMCQTCAPLPEPVYVAPPEPVYVAPPEPEPVFLAPPEPEPEHQPVVASEAEAEPEPIVIVEPEAEPEPVVVAEPEPDLEAVVAAQAEAEPEPATVEPAPEPATRPAPPRMPVLPLPRPRPANAPILPLPALPDYPVAPQIAFTEQANAAASTAAAEPLYEQHTLLAAPRRAAQAGAAGLRPCGNCQLSLSARAHFCRRCGTAQPN